ncbi:MULTISPECIES: GNAT family N-acetyltransferase [Methylomonas]|nr:GNAT family N-acetyltransferase [Methylomonas koyamae]
MIVTERLKIRNFVESDCEVLVSMLQDSVFMAYSEAGALATDRAVARYREILEYSKSGLGKKALILKDTNQIIGYCGIEPFELDGKRELELGYRLIASYRGHGHGYATEAARAVISAFAGPKLFAYVESENTKSLNVLVKLGFEELGLRQIKEKSYLLFLRAENCRGLGG